MKGRFSLRLNDGYLSFGNLGEKGLLGELSDSRVNLDNLIAHDVIEHSVAHRTKKYVTYEDELRATGAIEFVRMGEFEMYKEVSTTMPWDYHRELKPVPYIIGQHLINERHVDVDLIRYLIKEGHSVHNSRCAAMHVAWGYLQKQHYYNDYHGRAAHDFHFIKHNVPQIIQEFSWEEVYTGISVYFDTDKQIIRTSFIRKYEPWINHY